MIRRPCQPRKCIRAKLRVFKRETETKPLSSMGLSIGAVRRIRWLMKIENPREIDLQKGFRNPDTFRRLTAGALGSEIKKFGIQHGMVQQDLSDLGMKTIPFRRVSRLIGKPFPTLSDLLEWCNSRGTRRQGFQPMPGSTDAQIEEFVISSKYPNPALAYFNLGVRAVNCLRKVVHSDVPGLLDLKRIVEEHPDKAEREAWFKSEANCAGKTRWDMEDVIAKQFGGKTALPQKP